MAELASISERFDEWRSKGRAVTDLSDLARAAASGAIDTLLVDFNAEVRGSVSESGALRLDEQSRHDVLEEVARLALASDARVLALRRADLPDGAEAAGLLRYAP